MPANPPSMVTSPDKASSNVNDNMPRVLQLLQAKELPGHINDGAVQLPAMDDPLRGY
eukprot:CAMPEP_0117665090 /NCGR_PEP_ID=MMETSP0804-20121206/9611_1 /TAXON_ID=1074897 /ORGANISM="Tetraselmis astigmatica, Strain CCMP880" /LENGTH=56 /DNA_ID=CAMNT_0005472453 /DNA_START=337 /DNA_END=506 /DNA_ORIENTATION=-